jgi:hypothetical protein
MPLEPFFHRTDHFIGLAHGVRQHFLDAFTCRRNRRQAVAPVAFKQQAVEGFDIVYDFDFIRARRGGRFYSGTGGRCFAQKARDITNHILGDLFDFGARPRAKRMRNQRNG